MKLRYALAILFAVPCMTVFANGDAFAAKEKFVRTKPHVNVSGPYQLNADTIRVAVGLVDPAVQGGLASPSSDGSCTGQATLRIMDAANPEGPALAESTDLSLTTADLQALEYVAGSTPENVYSVIAVEDMDVDGKRCVFRGRIQVRDNSTAQVDVEQQVYRQDFGQVKLPR